jgi:hypothetical protein
MLRIQNAILHSAGLSLLVAGLAVINKDLRGHFSNVLAGDSETELAMIAVPANRLGRQTLETLREYQIDNELLAFGAVALVLFFFLFRS